MTKKNKDFVKELQEAQQQGKIKPSQIKKSKSLESLTTQSPDKQIQALKDQVKFEVNKSQNYLNQITTLTAEIDSKEQAIKELVAKQNKLTDQNNELRINNLQQRDYFSKYQAESKLTNQLKLKVSQLQKDLTITQQDLKTSQRIIELRTIESANDKDQKSPFNYWILIRIGLLALIVYLTFNNQDKHHGKH
jgi:chromosome segregation ATPase